MFEQLGDEMKSTLKSWTQKMIGEDFDRRVQALRHNENEYGVDPYGFNLDFALSALAPLLWMYKNYFRVQTFGIEKIPPGRVLLVSNHSGQLPLDGAMIGVALLAEADPPRAIRSMVEKWVPTLPYVSMVFSRIGQVVGTPENCRRLLESGEAILIFPEGVRGLGKLWPKRYQLQEFGLGFMRLALETKTPVLPVAVVGAEEQAPGLFNVKPIANLLGFPYLNVTPTVLPLPLPTRYRIYFGEPIHFTGRPDDDDGELEKKVRTVQSTIQDMLNQGLKERTHVFR